MRKGIAISPGIAIGAAYCIEAIYVNPDQAKLNEAEVPGELARLDAAIEAVSADLRKLQARVDFQLGKEAAAVFAVHESILRDPALAGRMREAVRRERISSQEALRQLMEEYDDLMSHHSDALLRDRISDIRDVGQRLSVYLSDVLQGDPPELRGPVVIVAAELLPSQLFALGDREISAIVTSTGSQTSHAAIIARSRGIPAVVGVRDILSQVATGQMVVVDGREGVVIVGPEPETEAAYRKLEREYVDLKDRLAANRDLPAQTADGHPLRLLANINSLADAEMAVKMGASGVGLYRTEYLYLLHPDVPDEDEQAEVYGQMIAASPHRDITIRTLDIGGDKGVPYLGHGGRESNPFMGWRSIRLSFEHPEFFATQLRAILRAATAAQSQADISLRLLFPMITNLEELVYLRAMVRRAESQLRLRGLEPIEVPIGMMVEVPAAALVIDQLLEFVDFVSIGSNDLVQYVMAADRDNPKVNHLCQPLAPAMLRLIWSVVKECRRANKPVTLCGEMAGQPEAAALLLGMGLDRLSMSPALVPTIKELASHITQAAANELLTEAMQLRTTTEVRQLARRFVEAVAPNLDPLVARS
ncbi:phosphoenolpyruvate--protein phosphotransferase [Planctomycetaceae bacterium SH139]